MSSSLIRQSVSSSVLHRCRLRTGSSVEHTKYGGELLVGGNLRKDRLASKWGRHILQRSHRTSFAAHATCGQLEVTSSGTALLIGLHQKIVHSSRSWIAGVRVLR